MGMAAAKADPRNHIGNGRHQSQTTMARAPMVDSHCSAYAVATDAPASRAAANTVVIKAYGNDPLANHSVTTGRAWKKACHAAVPKAIQLANARVITAVAIAASAR